MDDYRKFRETAAQQHLEQKSLRLELRGGTVRAATVEALKRTDRRDVFSARERGGDSNVEVTPGRVPGLFSNAAWNERQLIECNAAKCLQKCLPFNIWRPVTLQSLIFIA